MGEEFDFSFHPSIKKNRLFEPATCRLARECQDVLLVGTGKSHLAQSPGLAAVRRGHTGFHRSIFDTVRDVADKILPARQAF